MLDLVMCVLVGACVVLSVGAAIVGLMPARTQAPSDMPSREVYAVMVTDSGDLIGYRVN